MRPAQFRHGFALLLATVVFLLSASASAFQPESARVIDRLWATGQPWVVFSTPTLYNTLRVRVTGLAVSCVDPVAGRYLAPGGVAPEMCPGGMHNPDLYVHVFRNIAGELQTPLHCTLGTCEKTFDAPALGALEFGLLVHGGPNAPGRMIGTVEVWSGSTLVHSAPLDVAGSIMVDVSDPPSGLYEVHSVLVPDGPVRQSDGSFVLGNSSNDHLGVDATEMWVLGPDLRVIGTDLQQTGVGPAAHFNEWDQYRFSGAAWVVVRPWSRPAGGILEVRVQEPWMGSPAPVSWADGAKSPTVGNGRMRVIVNTLADDPDHDHVSTAVERALQTCDGLQPFAGRWPCITIVERDFDMAQRAAPESFQWSDSRDTDGDGLSDRAEIFGADFTFGSPAQATGACSTTVGQYIPDADQTFPLWNFNPRHKDVLIEVDAALPAIPNSSTCPQGPSSCGLGSVLTPTVPSAAPPGEMPLLPAGLLTSAGVLADIHARYAALPSYRVGNPDGLPGIEVHFDALAPVVASAGHGMVPAIDFFDSSLRPHPGLVVYNPPGRSGSTCSCQGPTACPSARHAGFSHYGVLNAAGGGGNSPYNTSFSAGYSGSTVAHELGHQLGLSHGGPQRALDSDVSPGANHNPFGFTGVEASDLDATHKAVFFSLMSYAYGNGPFSVGARALTPLPRRNASGVLVYPEQGTYGGRDTSHLSLYEALQPGPSGCSSGTGSCVDVDFSRDGSFSGEFGGTVESQAPFWLGGKHNMVRVPGLWCSEERRLPTRDAPLCCNFGTIDSSNTCPTPGTSGARVAPTNEPTTNTMLLAASPAAITLNNRLYTFFIDDTTNAGDGAAANVDDAFGRTLPRRCVVGAPCTPAVFGRLRWAAVDGLRIPPPFRPGQNACLGLLADCVTVAPGARAFGTVAVTYPDGAGGTTTGPVDVIGTTDLTATVLRNAAGTPTTVVVAWASRTSPFCPPRTDACRDTWGPMEVRFIDPAQLETGTFQMVPAGQRRPAFPPGPGGVAQGTRVSSVSLVAWNPNATGPNTEDKALLVVREAAGAPTGPQPGGKVWYSVCDGTTGCGTMQPLTDAAGNQLLSDTDVAAAIDAPPSTLSPAVAPALVLAMGQPADTTDANSPIAVWRFSPNGLGGLTGVERDLRTSAGGAPAPVPSILFSALPESGLSLAFSRDGGASSGRMLFVAEQGGTQAGGIPVPYYMATVAWPFTSSGAVIATRPSEVLWGYTRPSYGWRGSSPPGTPVRWLTQRGDAPGHVPTLFFDDRVGLAAGATSEELTELSRYERRVRSLRVSQEASGPTLFMTLSTDPAPLQELRDYDEAATLGWQLCRTITATSRGELWPELASSSSTPPGGPFRCPAAIANARSSAYALRMAQMIVRRCHGACLQWSPPTEIFDEIANMIASPHMFATTPPTTLETGLIPLQPGVGGPSVCAVGNELASYLHYEQPQ